MSIILFLSSKNVCRIKFNIRAGVRMVRRSQCDINSKLVFMLIKFFLVDNKNYFSIGQVYKMLYRARDHPWI